MMVDAVESDPLLGMSLLHGYDLCIRNVDGGEVSIQRIPAP